MGLLYLYHFTFTFTFPATTDVLTAVLMTQVFYNVTPYGLTYCYRRFEGSCKSSWITPKMEGESSYKMLVIMYRCAEYRIPEVLKFQCLSYLSTSSKAAQELKNVTDKPTQKMATKQQCLVDQLSSVSTPDLSPATVFSSLEVPSWFSSGHHVSSCFFCITQKSYCAFIRRYYYCRAHSQSCEKRLLAS